MELDKLDEVFNSEVGKRHDAVISDAIDPDDAVLGIHFVGHVPQPVFVFAEVLSDTSDGGDMMNLVECMVTQLERRSLSSVMSNSRAAVRPADEPDGRRCERGHRPAKLVDRLHSSWP